MRWTVRVYRKLFLSLERDGDLDAEDPVHIWCLHLIFLPMLNLSLKRWQASCHTPLSSVVPAES